MQTIAEFKCAFHDHQIAQANIFEALLKEIVLLNDKLKEAEKVSQKDQPKKD
jgi:hypothetical protein